MKINNNKTNTNSVANANQIPLNIQNEIVKRKKTAKPKDYISSEESLKQLQEKFKLK